MIGVSWAASADNDAPTHTLCQARPMTLEVGMEVQISPDMGTIHQAGRRLRRCLLPPPLLPSCILLLLLLPPPPPPPSPSPFSPIRPAADPSSVFPSPAASRYPPLTRKPQNQKKSKAAAWNFMGTKSSALQYEGTEREKENRGGRRRRRR